MEGNLFLSLSLSISLPLLNSPLICLLISGQVADKLRQDGLFVSLTFWALKNAFHLGF